MGNCLKHDASTHWGGDDWGSPLSHHSNRRSSEVEEESLLGSKTSSSTSTTEIKIKITKKELEKLLGKVDVQGLSVEQVLKHLMKVSDEFHTHHRSWKPALQSIPEVWGVQDRISLEWG